MTTYLVRVKGIVALRLTFFFIGQYRLFWVAVKKPMPSYLRDGL